VQKPKFDLSSVKDLDMGALIKQSYEAEFGKADVDAKAEDGDESGQPQSGSDDGDADQTDELDQNFIDAVGRGLEAANDDDSLEKVMQSVQEEVQAYEAEKAAQEEAAQLEEAQEGSDEGEQQAQAGQGAGSGDPEPVKPIAMPADSRLSGVASQLMRVLIGAMQDKRVRPMKFTTSGSSVAASKLWRLKKLGDTNVFKMQTKVSGINAAVKILLDRSGSMEEVIVDATKAALVCSQAFARISTVLASIDLFPSVEFASRYFDLYGKTPEQIAVMHPELCATETLQAFGQSVRQVAAKCDQVYATGGTPMADAIQRAVPDLLKQRTQKHYLFVIADGAPDNWVTTVAQIRAAEAKGVVVVGIGLGEGCNMQALIPNSVHIKDVAELPDALEMMFRTQVLQAAA
jgi:hypothetical protein